GGRPEPLALHAGEEHAGDRVALARRIHDAAGADAERDALVVRHVAIRVARAVRVRRARRRRWHARAVAADRRRVARWIAAERIDVAGIAGVLTMATTTGNNGGEHDGEPAHG